MKHRHDQGYAEPFLDTWVFTSGIRDWNAGCKTALSATALIICIVADHIYVSAAILILSFLIGIFPGRRKVKELLTVMRIPALFIILGCVAMAIEFAAAPIGTWRIEIGSIWIGVSETGLRRAGEILLKAFAAISAMYMLTLSTAMEEILEVLRKLHCPALLLELMYMIYRNIFILVQMNSRMQTAAQARMGYRDFKTSCKFRPDWCEFIFTFAETCQ